MKLFWRRKKEEKPRSFVREWYNSIVFAVIVATLIRWSVVQAFVIPTPSMENSLLVGDYLFVSKIHYGPQTPKTPLQIPLTHQKIWGTDIPSYLDWIQLPAYRFPGISHVKRMDVVVFNVPDLQMNGGVKYPTDLKTYYVKRCVGIPGDRLLIRDGKVIVNDVPLPVLPGMKSGYIVTGKDEINPRNLLRLGIDRNDYMFMGRRQDNAAVYRMFLTAVQATTIREQAWIISSEPDPAIHDAAEEPLYPADHKGWSQDNYGTITVPKEGMMIDVNDSTMNLYGVVIREYEGNEKAEIAGGSLSVNGERLKNYTFKQDYYFMMGDNRHNSLDSRYWGFVPADHIIGKPLFIWFSVDGDAKLAHKIRWNRIFNVIH